MAQEQEYEDNLDTPGQDQDEIPAILNVSPRRERDRGTDPLFGLLLAGAVSVGLTPLIGSGASDMRYTIVWGMLALFGVMAWLLRGEPHIERDYPDNLAWGVAFGLLLAIPLLAFGNTTLVEGANLLFRDMTTGTLLAYLVFVMPLAETLFFRGLLQAARPFWAVALICTIWQSVLFFPLINVQAFPLIIGIILLMCNLMYGYIRERNGLAATWLCQITVNLLLFFIPFSGII